MESDNSSNENIEVVFRNPFIANRGSGGSSTTTSSTTSYRGVPANGDNVKICDIQSSQNLNLSSFRAEDGIGSEKCNQISSCKVLQRKLELKVERAKRNYSQLYEENGTKSKSSSMIPITRLQIPGCQENVPLVEYNTDEHTDDDDDCDEISFFPARTKSRTKQDLSDTFSIQEMTIETDTDESESQNLELLPPSDGDKSIEKILSCLCCVDQRRQNCILM